MSPEGPGPERPARPRGTRLTQILEIAGKVLLGAGVVLVLFIVYQVWGTALIQSHTQAGLRSTLRQEIPQSVRHDRPPKPPTSGPPKVAAPAAAPANGQAIGYLRIPSIGVDQVVVQGTDTTDLTKGPGHYPGSPLPGELGNSAIAGHRTTWGHPFYDLNAVPVGATIYLTTPQGSFTYTTRRVFVVSPTDNSVLQATVTPSLTLTTCNPRYSAAQRLILRATLTASRLTGAAGHLYRPGSGPTGTHLAGSTSGAWWVVVVWGLGTIALGTLLWLIARRFTRRWLIYLAGLPLLLVLLYFLFASVTPLLPASI